MEEITLEILTRMISAGYRWIAGVPEQEGRASTAVAPQSPRHEISNDQEVEDQKGGASNEELKGEISEEDVSSDDDGDDDRKDSGMSTLSSEEGENEEAAVGNGESLNRPVISSICEEPLTQNAVVPLEVYGDCTRIRDEPEGMCGPADIHYGEESIYVTAQNNPETTMAENDASLLFKKMSNETLEYQTDETENKEMPISANVNELERSQAEGESTDTERLTVNNAELALGSDVETDINNTPFSTESKNAEGNEEIHSYSFDTNGNNEESVPAGSSSHVAGGIISSHPSSHEQNSHDSNAGSETSQCDADGTQNVYITSFQQFSKTMDLLFPGNGEKVLIVHSQEDCALAKAIRGGLKRKTAYRVVAQCEIENIVRFDSQEFNNPIDWADIIVPVITDCWLNEISRVGPSGKLPTDSLITRNMYVTHLNNYLIAASLNFSCVAVVKIGTSQNYRKYPLFVDAVRVAEIPQEEEIQDLKEKISERLNTVKILKAKVN